MKILLIRHGETKGNQEGRYVGVTDEPITQTSKKELEQMYLEQKDWLSGFQRIYTSPMKRCRESAGCLFPGREPVIINDFRECDFGIFEYKNYEELNGNPEYQAYIDSGGELPFPCGESREQFQRRCVRAYASCGIEEAKGDVAMVVHGGTIMALMNEFSEPHRDYFEWQVKNGHGILLELQKEKEGSRFIKIKDI